MKVRMSLALGLTLAGCGVNGAASRSFDAPAAPATGTQQPAADATAAQGPAIDIDMAAYVDPRGEPLAAPTFDDAFWAHFPTSCEENAPAAEGQAAQVALVVNGQCQVFPRSEVEQHLGQLSTAFAAYGVNLTQKVDGSTELSTLTEQGEVVADPEINLGEIVGTQISSITPESTDPNPTMIALTMLVDNRWGGAMGPRVFGSNQFGVSAGARFWVQHVNGIGIDTGLDIDGKVFGNTIGVVNGGLVGTGLDGNAASLRASFRLFGTSLLDRTLTEPEWRGAGELATISRSLSGTLRFSLGPIPFNTRWVVSLSGGVPWEVAARPTGVSASLSPNLNSAASLEGGPSIVVASAGVGGNLTLIEARMVNAAEASLQRRESQNQLCYRINSALNFDRMLAGRLYAYGIVGWPDRTVFGRPLGWRGDLEFVQWAGMTHNIPIFSTGQELTCQTII